MGPLKLFARELVKGQRSNEQVSCSEPQLMAAVVSVPHLLTGTVFAAGEPVEEIVVGGISFVKEII